METMKTEKNAKQPAAPAKAPQNELAAELATMPGIPVLELRFCVPAGRDVPGQTSGGTGTLRTTAEREITYLPKVMLHRVIQKSRDPKLEDLVFYIPREWATFQPL